MGGLVARALLAGHPLLALDFDWPRLRDQVLWSWDHHDTLKYLAAGVALVIVASISNRREWNPFFTGLAAVGGVGCIAAAGVMAMLGDDVRRTPAMDTVGAARLYRESHGESAGLLRPGEPCTSTYDCGHGFVCTTVTDEPRCYLRCPATGRCAGGSPCVAGQQSVKVCGTDR